MVSVRRKFIPMPELTDRLLARMDEKTVVAESGCRAWTGGKDKDGYGHAWAAGAIMLVHRIAFFRETGVDPEESFVDHACFNPTCLNPAHLRLVTNKQNMENRSGMSKANTSGFRGATWSKARGKWQAQVQHNGTNKILGYFLTAAEAGAVAQVARLQIFTHNNLDRAE